MSMTREDAAAALRAVERTEARTRLSRTYRAGGAHLILWGVIWIVGYGLTGVLPPRQVYWAWLVLDTIGAIGATLIARRSPSPEQGWRWAVAFVAVFAFVAATYVVMRPREAIQFEVYPAVAVSLVYVLAGIWRGARYVWIGAGVFVLTMIGYFFVPLAILPFWLAAVGGGGLILGGLWLRRA